MRKKLYLAAAALGMLVALFALCACEKVEDMGTLPEFSKPYLGEYVCEKLLVGGKDQKDKFEYVTLTLLPDGEFQLTYKMIYGGEGEYGGAYTVNETLDKITLSAKAGGRTATRTFPMENGAIYVDLTFHGKLLHAEFRFP